ncbi:MAG TPA: FhaA domain-containing protein [Candidatus Limnocylindrales bacterium]
MSRVERFFERLVERPSARIFRTRLQPIQVLRRVERAMEAGRRVEAGREVAPDRFTVHLHPADLAELGDPAIVAGDVASGALAFARSHNLLLLDRPRVGIRADDAVVRGEVEVAASVTPPSAGGAPALDSETRAFEIPVPRAPKATLEIREPGRLSRTVDVTGPMRIGRATESELPITDPRVSRLHARVHARGGHLVLTDLGSTNGTRVNGQRIREVVLGDGDVISIGETELVVGGHAQDAPAGR